MIRIDEIYNHTFWPFIKKNIPRTRLFFCDPPGSTSSDSLLNFGETDRSNALPGEEDSELNFIYCHDQEPVYFDLHQPLFDSVNNRNLDLDYNTGARHSAIIVSELNSQSVQQVCMQYNWKSYYYFFHGWAALDWYRGYNQTYLMPSFEERKNKYSFISPNRIIGGRRDHRVLLMYHLLSRETTSALISFPKYCPQENTSVIDIGRNYQDQYSNIGVKLTAANFPWSMPNESGHPMHSCWLSLFEENAASLVHVITETSYFGHKLHLTEKTFKPICLQMPFVLVSNAGSLNYLKKYGFRTFDTVWDESYDNELDDFVRLEKIADLLKWFDDMTPSMRQDLHQACSRIVKHNFNHFYNGGFEKILTHEFNSMLTQLCQDFNQ